MTVRNRDADSSSNRGMVKSALHLSHLRDLVVGATSVPQAHHRASLSAIFEPSLAHEHWGPFATLIVLDWPHASEPIMQHLNSRQSLSLCSVVANF